MALSLALLKYNLYLCGDFEETHDKQNTKRKSVVLFRLYVGRRELFLQFRDLLFDNIKCVGYFYQRIFFVRFVCDINIQ